MGKLRDFMSAKEVEMFEAFKGHNVLDSELADSQIKEGLYTIYSVLSTMIMYMPSSMPQEGRKYLKSFSRAKSYRETNINVDKATLDSLIYEEDIV